MEPGNEKYRLLIENLPDAFAYCQVVTDSAGHPVDYIFLDVNDAFTDMIGLSQDKIIGKKVTEVHPGIESLSFDWIGTYGKVVLTGESASFEQYFEPAGSWYNVIAYSNLYGYFAVLFRDITERKQAEEALRESEQRYRLLVDHAGEAIVVIQDGIVKFANPATVQTFGYSEEKLGSMPFIEFLHPEDRNLAIEEYTKALSGKTVGPNYTIRVITENDNIKWVEFNAVQIEWENQPAVLGFARDIIKNKQAEDELRKKEEKYRLLSENATDVIWTTDLDLNYTYVSPSEERISGYTVEEIMSIGVHNILTPSSLERAFQVIQEELELEASGEAEPSRTRIIELEQYCKDGSTAWVEIKASFLRDQEGRPYGIFGITRDITDRKLAEEALNYRFQFEKLISEISTRFLNLPSEKIDERISYALKLTGEFFNVDRSCVFQFSADEQIMSNTHEWCAEGIEPQMDKIQNQPLESLPWWAEQVRNRDYVHIPDVDSLSPEAEAEREEFQHQGIQSLLTVPLRSKDRFIGFFGFNSVKEKKTWTEETISLLKFIADILVNAFEKNETEEEILYMSFHDNITGLYNRRFLEEEMQRLDTERQLPISIIIIDLNGLKLANDTYGHTKGDEMLKHTASILRKTCREEDILARWGGDEFVILLPQTTSEEARVICERINDNCREAYVEDIPVSLALGAATKDSSEKELADILNEAEDDMYKQKLAEYRSTRSAFLNALLKTLAEKSFETETHTRRMQNMAMKLGEKMGLSDSELSRLAILISLHDIGKINISEEILTKEGALTTKEWEIIKKHPETGFRIARATEEFVHVAEDILSHHERWDGSGYPQGLKGKEIPLLARITAVADAYEVMTSGRPYKKALPSSEAATEIRRCAGTQFDPELVEVFVSVLEEQAII